MSSPTVAPDLYDLIEGVVGTLAPKAQEDARNLLQGLVRGVSQLSTATGVAQGQSSQNAPAPPNPGLSVSAGNGVFTLTITPGSAAQSQQTWFQVRYSTVKGMTSGVTTMPPTQSTSVSLNLPGQSLYFQVRASTNQQVWTAWIAGNLTAAASGLVSSAATAAGAAFAQTNLMTVTSAAAGSHVTVNVQGAGGALTSGVLLKSGEQTVAPPGAIVGVTPGSDQFVGYDGTQYKLEPTLGAVLLDALTPIGKVSVVDTGTPTLPVVTLVLGAGGTVIGWNVTNQGNGLTGPVTLTIVTSTGTGATPGAQTIEAGKLISVAPVNPGANYAGGDTVTVSGGVSPGVPGGGTATAGNGGRMTNV